MENARVLFSNIVYQMHSASTQDLPRPWTASGFITLLTHALMTPYFDVSTKADIFVAVETIVSHEHLRASTRATIAAKTLEVLNRCGLKNLARRLLEEGKLN